MHKILKHYYGHMILGVLIFFPVVLWLVQAGLSPLVASPSTFVKALGKTAALIGFAAYCLMPVLSMRYKILEKLFGGMGMLYSLHKRIGKLSFYFLWAHPVLLALSGIIAGRGLLAVWDWSSLLIISGIIAILSFTAITAITIYAHIKHQNWIKIHRFFGWLLPLFMLHAFVARGQIVQNTALLTYMLSLALVGMAAFLYRSVLGNWLIKRYRYEVAEINQVAETVTELVLKPTGIPITYNSGQFAFVTLVSPSIDNESHPFSFTTAPNGPYIRFVIKELGDDTSKVKDVQKGTLVFLEGPYGKFSFRNSKNRNQVWIAGGVGITPFLSMARSFTNDSNYKILFVYGSEKLEDAVFLEELFDIRKTIPDVFDVTVVNRNLSGFVTIEILKKELKDLSESDYFICGPPPMLNSLKQGLTANGVAPERIFTEEFSM